MAKQGQRSWELPAVSCGKMQSASFLEGLSTRWSGRCEARAIQERGPEQMYHERRSNVFGVHVKEAHARHDHTTDHAAEDKTHVY